MVRRFSLLVGLVSYIWLDLLCFLIKLSKGIGKKYLIQYIIQGLYIKYNTVDDIEVISNTGVLFSKIGGKFHY